MTRTPDKTELFDVLSYYGCEYSREKVIDVQLIPLNVTGEVRGTRQAFAVTKTQMSKKISNLKFEISSLKL